MKNPAWALSLLVASLGVVVLEAALEDVALITEVEYFAAGTLNAPDVVFGVI